MLVLCGECLESTHGQRAELSQAAIEAYFTSVAAAAVHRQQSGRVHYTLGGTATLALVRCHAIGSLSPPPAPVPAPAQCHVRLSKHTLLNICYPQTAPPLYITANKQELDKMQITLANRINKHPIEYGENISIVSIHSCRYLNKNINSTN